MPTYAYEAMNQAGHEVKDEIEANTTEDALAKIKSLGYFPTKIREKGGTKAKASGKRKGTGFSIGMGRAEALDCIHPSTLHTCGRGPADHAKLEHPRGAAKAGQAQERFKADGRRYRRWSHTV